MTGGAGADVSFTTTGAESSATSVAYTDSTGGDISSSVDTAGVVLATSSVPTITFASGVTAVAATATSTVPSALVAGADDASITIDGVVIALGAGAYARNEVWQTNRSLWEDVLEKNPTIIKIENGIKNHPRLIIKFLKKGKYKFVSSVF